MRRGAAGRETDNGLSEVIGFILLLGVITAAFALWMMYVVPANGREAEINQMNDVKDRFTDYKISLDSLWINRQNGVLLSTSFNLGTGGGNTQVGGLFMPMMNPVSSSATMTVRDTGETLTISSNGDSGAESTTYTMSALEYQSLNNYWIQQKYYYQDGGVFLTQQNGSTCRVSPPISFINNSDKTAAVVIVPITLDNTGSMGGNGPVRVDTRLRSLSANTSVTKYWVTTCVSVSNYTTAMMWMDVFNNSRRNGGIYDSRNYSFGNSSPSAIPAFAYMKIKGPYDDESTSDVILSVQPVNFSVTINSIATSLN